jgi:hypothetical protein
MHVIQQIAVTAESAEEAMASVKNTFDEQYSESEGLGGWSDWYVVGGGRWNSNPSNQYNDSSNDIISYGDNPELFNSTLQKFLEYRREEATRLAKEANLDNFSEAVDKFCTGEFTDTDRFDMNIYYVKKLAELLNGQWNSDSSFYDLTNYSTSPKYMLDSIDNGNKTWYLVPVDFHF